MKYIYITLILFFQISCRNRQQIEDNLFTISIEKGLNNYKDFNLNKFSKDIIYFKFETNDASLINKPSQVLIKDSNIFIFDKKMRSLLRFTNNGKFINKIGKPGKMSGEYFELGEVSLGSGDSTIYVQNFCNFGQILKYSYSGQFLGLIRNYEGIYSRMLSKNCKVDYFIKPNLFKSNFYRLIISDTTGKVLAKYLPQKIIQESKSENSIGLASSFYIYNDSLTFWENPSDTIFRLTPQLKLIPRYILDYGEKKMPIEYFRNWKIFEEKIDKFPFLMQIFETEQFIFLTLAENQIMKFLVYEKQTQDVFILEHGLSVVLNENEKCFSFWPDGVLNDGRLFMILDIVKIKQILREKKLDQNSIIEKGEIKKLVKLIEQSQDDDNPLIMVVTL